ncbi:MAG: type II toxin-antitoxin system VapC family toxin [Terracidiphilus sp.]
MELILDASVTLAWMVRRVDPIEAQLADDLLSQIERKNAKVPALWFPEVANGVLVAERRTGIGSSTSANFLRLLDTLPIVEDETPPFAVQSTVLTLARAYKLTAYGATYLELVLRKGGELATFDRQLADAARSAGARVFGDPA